MRIAGCIIVKDDSELENLRRCIASIKKWVDSIYITANGQEVGKILKFCQKENLNYSFKPWDKDFSEMRNFNFSQVPDGYDFLFWMDTDDVLIGGQYLKEVAKQAKDNDKDWVFFTYWYGAQFEGDPSPETLKDVDMVQMRERLIRPGTSTWKGRLHETLIPVNGQRDRYSKYTYDKVERPIAILHCAKDSDFVDKMSRNREILEMQLKEERETKEGADPRTLLYLMKIYVESDEPKILNECLKMGEEYLSKSGWDQEMGVCWHHMGLCHSKLGDDPQAIKCFMESINIWPHNLLVYVNLAASYYNLDRYREADFWLKMVAAQELPKEDSQMVNVKAIKVLFAELLTKIRFNVAKDTKGALEAAQMAYSVDPTPGNAENLAFLESQDALNTACGNVDHLLEYLERINLGGNAQKVLEALPDAIVQQPFAIRWRHKLTPARVWEDKEICYFANFGKHFEEWGPRSLDDGIGGSETAVIYLAEQWTKMGYKVTVYGDPGRQAGTHNGVTWLPWYHFNKEDTFNIFIQWRGWSLADKIQCKRFLVDLHDVFAGVDINPEELEKIDKIMVKSNYHRSLAPKIPDEKFAVISNGIVV